MAKISKSVGRWDRSVWIRVLVGVSFFLIVVGHWKINGLVFDPIHGETYNVYTRWVSDFAGKTPEGYWIKAGILTFSVGLLLLLQPLSVREAADWRGVWRGLGVLTMATLMSGGLILVAVFDISPQQFEIIENQVIIERATAREAAAAPELAEEDGAPVGEEGAEVAEDESWWGGIFDPRGPTLREELMRDSLPQTERYRELIQTFRSQDWDQDRIVVHLRELAEREAEEARLLADAVSAPATLETEADETMTEEIIRRVPMAPREASKQRYHRIGFQFFLVGFLGCSIWMAWKEWKSHSYQRLPGTLLTLLLSLVFSGWLFVEKFGLAGIPQRALLVLIGIWVLRNLWHLEEKEPTPGGGHADAAGEEAPAASAARSPRRMRPVA